MWSWFPESSIFSDKSVDELDRIEGNQIADRLAEPDQLHRQAELSFDGEHDPALGRAVELGQHHARHLRGVSELASLGKTVLSRRRVDDEQDLGDLPGALCGYSTDLAQFFHQVRLGV